MKKIAFIVSGLATTALLAFTTVKTDNLKIDTKKSVIEWTGKKIGGAHNGEIKLSAGTITLANGVPSKGSFVIDMKTITNKDLTDAEYNGKLIGHLKSEDFFGVDKFPSAQFVATSITPSAAGAVNVTGNLTIKGITKPISFAATYAVSGNTLTATATGVKVDRTKYNIKYGSKSFFESIGDKAIDDEFTLNINIVASK